MLIQKFIQDAEKSMPKLHEVMGGGTKTKISCQGTVRRRCVLAALQTVKLGLTIFLKYSVIYLRVFNLCVTVVTRNELILDLLHQLWLQTAPTAMP